MLLRDAEIRLDKLHGADAPQTHQDFRLHQLHLPPQIAAARLLLGVQRIPVLRRAALDTVGDIDALTGQADHLQHIVQQLPGPAHKRLPLLVLVGAGGLPHQQHLRRRIAYAEHHLGPLLRQTARPAGQTPLPQLLPLLIHGAPPLTHSIVPSISGALTLAYRRYQHSRKKWLWQVGIPILLRDTLSPERRRCPCTSGAF